MAPAHYLRDISTLATRLAIEARSNGADGTDVQNPGLIPGLVIGGVATVALVVALFLCVEGGKEASGAGFPVIERWFSSRQGDFL